MTVEITTLGTGSSYPNKRRNVSSTFVNFEGVKMLFDCGEGTQRQMRQFETGFAIEAIFLSHTHGDHIYGLPGLMSTMDFIGRDDELMICCHKDSMSKVNDVVPNVSYDVRIKAADKFYSDGFTVDCFETDHTPNSIGYTIQEGKQKGRFNRPKAESLGVPAGPKFSELHEGNDVTLEDGTVVRSEQVVGPSRRGRKICYTGDTFPTESVIEAVEGADLLIHEATFTHDKYSRARNTKHSTALGAGMVADRANVKKLVLTHFSPSYSHESQHVKECEFDNVVAAKDGKKLDVMKPE